MNKVSTAWYNQSKEEITSSFSVTPNGLSAVEAAERLKKKGPNTLPPPKTKNIGIIFLSQFLSPLIYVLIGAAILSAIARETSDALFIAAIIVINALLGTWQEWQAENSAAALKSLVTVRARIKRDGKIQEVDASEIVPGDMVMLESGVKVPADIRLFKARELSIEEALLTGPFTGRSDQYGFHSHHGGQRPWLGICRSYCYRYGNWQDCGFALRRKSRKTSPDPANGCFFKEDQHRSSSSLCAVGSHRLVPGHAHYGDLLPDDCGGCVSYS